MLFAGQEDVARVVVSGDNRWVISSSKDGTIQRSDLNSTTRPPTRTRLGQFPGAAGVIAASTNGRWLASATGLTKREAQGTYGQQIPNEHTITLWDFTANEMLKPTVLRGHERPVGSVAFSADSQWLTSGSSDGKVRIWRLVASGEAEFQHELTSSHSVDVLEISRDQRWLATTAANQFREAAITLWSRPFTAQRRRIVLGMQSSNRKGSPTLSISLDSHWLAVANAHRSIVRLWDMSGEDPSLKVTDLDILPETKDDPAAPWKYISDLAFSPDGRWLAVVHNQEDGKQGAIWLWDLTAGPTGRRPVPLRGHEGYITDLTFSPDGKRLASASTDVWGMDNTIRIWHMQELQTSISPIVLRGHRAGVSTLAFSPDGRWLISAGEDRVLQRWPMTTEDLLERAREAVGRNLSAQEWNQYFVGQEYRKTFEAFPLGM
jgi:WD40 repeat protein